jgi:hypothetical protein
VVGSGWAGTVAAGWGQRLCFVLVRYEMRSVDTPGCTRAWIGFGNLQQLKGIVVD